jgi:hypothetical protein
MKKEEIKAFILKYPSIKSNEIIEILLNNNEILIGFFDLQDQKNEQLNKWTFTNVFNQKKTIFNGEDIIKINFYREGENIESYGELSNKYGYCSIPKGTLLFRKGDSKKLKNCIYFSLVDFSANTNDDDKTLKFWKTKKEIVLLFMISHITQTSNPYSSITDIYNDYITNKKLTDLDIKLNLTKRDQVITILQNDNNIGWFSSIEDSKSELEICLFPKDFSTISEYVELVSETPVLKPNALEFITLYPSEEFLNKSQQIFNKNGSDYSKYENMINSWVTEYEEKGMTREHAINELSTIRTKLKI